MTARPRRAALPPSTLPTKRASQSLAAQSAAGRMDALGVLRTTSAAAQHNDELQP